MDSKRGLTAFAAGSEPAAEVKMLLEEAGLELWQAPEGFWAIRVKPSVAPSAASSAKRRRRPRSAA